MARVLLLATLLISVAVALASAQYTLRGHAVVRCLWDAVDPLTPVDPLTTLLAAPLDPLTPVDPLTGVDSSKGECMPNSYYLLSGKVPAPTDELGASYMAWMFTNETACNQHTDELSCRGSVYNCAWNGEVAVENAGTAADPHSTMNGGGFTMAVRGSQCVGIPPEEGGFLSSQPAEDAIQLITECLLAGSTQTNCSALKTKGCAWDGSDCVANSTMGLRHFLHEASKTPFTKALVAEEAECSSRATKGACVLASESVTISAGTFQQNLLQAESGKPGSSSSASAPVVTLTGTLMGTMLSIILLATAI
jgi:hypothetical protein